MAGQKAEESGPGSFFAMMVGNVSRGAFNASLTLRGTLISINENPFPYCDTLNEHQQYELNSIRQNLLNVFAQLSMVTDKDQPLNPIMTVQVRAGRKSSMAENQVHEADSPSLLLYYLFDDWYTSYSLVAKSDHEYRRQLNTIVSGPEVGRRHTNKGRERKCLNPRS